MTMPPGFRAIPDPEAEVRRLAGEREDPAWREWAVRHPGGKITVRIDGHPFMMRPGAEAEAATLNQDCEWCDGGTHVAVYRDKTPWQAP